MTIGLKVHGITTELGGGGLLHSFCSTVAVHLESGAWGSRYPVLQNKLYQGRVPAEDAGTLERELESIRAGLSRLSPDKAVWDIHDRSLEPAWGTTYGPHITDLAVYFVTNGRRNLIEVIGECAKLLDEVGGQLEVVSYRG